jgi:nucleoside-diphosphate-sugar epimerase
MLVTGGTGFTGKSLVRRLINDGHHVVALDYKEGVKTQELRELGAEVVIGSVADRDVVNRCMKGVEVVHHLAAAFRELNVPEQHYYNINVKGTRNVAEAALAAGVRKMVNCSTCGVHGNVANPPGGEDAPIQPADYYQRTKYQGEIAAHEYAAQGLKVTTLRPSAIYGPGDPERFFMIYKRVATGKFPMIGDGTTLYHPVYVENLVDAFLLAMEPGRGDGEAYLIADEEFITIEDLVKRIGRSLDIDVTIKRYPTWPVIAVGQICEKLCKPLGITPPIFPRRVDWYRQNRAFRIDKAKRELGYQPRIGLDEGLRATAAWYKQEGYL